MTGKIMPVRERDISTIQAAADAFLSWPRYASPNTWRGYADMLGRLLAGLGASRPLADVSGEALTIEDLDLDACLRRRVTAVSAMFMMTC